MPSARALPRPARKAAAELDKVEQKLANADFVARAPEAIIEENEERRQKFLHRDRPAGRGLGAHRMKEAKQNGCSSPTPKKP